MVIFELILKLLVYLNKVAGMYFFHSLSYHSLNDLQKAKESYTKVIKSEFDVVIRTPMNARRAFTWKHCIFTFENDMLSLYVLVLEKILLVPCAHLWNIFWHLKTKKFI